ncbi:MAG: DUF475 domain-containing protein, partial [Rhodobacteraceae bacterium]|nr:DUF475 domain-containing protein [Paracoccaceae bacterium]
MIREYSSGSDSAKCIAAKGLIHAKIATIAKGKTMRMPKTAINMPHVSAILAALEIALSFDNAIVNANKLEEMTPVWQRRFLTWGILIAVFGMRIVFPLAIVAIFAWINPFAAMHLALSDPDEYSRIIGEAHGPISAFGGTFLMMVAL